MKHFSLVLILLLLVGCSSNDLNNNTENDDYNDGHQEVEENDVTSDSEDLDNNTEEDDGNHEVSEDVSENDTESSNEQSENHEELENENLNDESGENDESRVNDEDVSDNKNESLTNEYSEEEILAMLVLENVDDIPAFRPEAIQSKEYYRQTRVETGIEEVGPVPLRKIVFNELEFGELPDLPENMRFFSVSPSIDFGFTLLGFNEEVALFTGGNGLPGTYLDLASNGKEFNLDEIEKSGDVYEEALSMVEVINIEERETRFVDKESVANIVGIYLENNINVDLASNIESLQSIQVASASDVMNPYAEESYYFPLYTYSIYLDYGGGNSVIYFNWLFDGNVEIYDLPMRFHDDKWFDNRYSLEETRRIIFDAEVYNLEESTHPLSDRIIPLIEDEGTFLE